MTGITASMVKELRERTGIGMMDCKEALVKANGSINLAIENMRKSGMIKAAKRASAVLNSGVVVTKIDNNCGFILEVNCQTDFVSKNSDFQKFVNKVLDTAITEKIANIDIEAFKSRFEEDRVLLVAKIDENISIRRMAFLEGEMMGSYQHGSRIGVLVAAKGADDKKLIKQLAMHIAASNPEFINPEDISTKTIEKEYQIQLNIAISSGKPREIAENIAKGRLKKFTSEISLTEQPFVIDPSKSVAQFLKEHNSIVTGFIRFEVGEDIKKIKTDFVTKVTNVSK